MSMPMPALLLLSTKGRCPALQLYDSLNELQLIVLTGSIMTALLELGAFIGALLAGFVADRYSRKKAIG